MLSLRGGPGQKSTQISRYPSLSHLTSLRAKSLGRVHSGVTAQTSWAWLLGFFIHCTDLGEAHFPSVTQFAFQLVDTSGAKGSLFSKLWQWAELCPMCFMSLSGWKASLSCPPYPNIVCTAAKSLQSCLTPCDPIDGSPSGSSVPGILQARNWSGLPFPSPIHACMLSRFSHVQLCATPWTAAHQAPLSMDWSGLPFPSPTVYTVTR